MKFKQANPELTTLLEAQLAAYPVEARKMFGCPCFFLVGNMMAGVFEDYLFLRLPANDRETALAADDEITAFDPLGGRPMREYIQLAESTYSDEIRLADLIESSHRYVSSLPPKKPKKQSKG